MQAASRESYTVAKDRLDNFAGNADASALARAAEELFAVAALFAGEPRLRRALADPARSGTDRASLVRSLLGERIGADALGLVETLVTGRWSRAGELLDAVEMLGVEALLAAADRAGGLAEVEDELFRFGQVVAGSPELAGALGDSVADAARRQGLVDSLLAGKTRPETVALAKLAVAGFGGRGFEASLRRLVELASERRDRQAAYITVAAALTDAEEQRLAVALGRIYGREVSLKVSVNPEVLGGISVQIGHDLYDGTMARRLTEARQSLIGRR